MDARDAGGSGRPVAFFDSGVGGLPYLEVAKRLMPSERFVYLTDRAGFPYGAKSRDRVRELALRGAAALVERFDPKAIVVACNTATVIALQDIRAAFPGTPVVGTVPAVKPAAAASIARVIGVLSTDRASDDPYLLDLIARWAPDCRVIRRGEQALVDFVENRLFEAGPAERLAAVRPAVDALKAEGADAIVLGCTHFLFLAPEFAEAAGSGVRIVDSRDGVASQLRRVLSSGAGLNAARPPEPDAMYLSGEGPFGAKYEGFAARFGLRPAGILYP